VYNIRQLSKIIREVHRNIAKGSASTIHHDIQPLYDLGLKANMHVGESEKFKELEGTDQGRLMTLEWYAGSIIDIVENKSYFAVNSWLNCIDKFCPRI
jgi:hypothetical protein